MKKDSLSNWILLGLLLAGLSLLLYPTVSDYWNSRTQSKAIAGYVQQVADLDGGAQDALLAAARAYNEALPADESRYLFTDEAREAYESVLDPGGDGVMGYVEIPTIGVTLPIYHGTENTILQVAVGHIEGTSLPVGGEGTHCALSGHRGLPSAKLFSDLDRVAAGDTFLLRVLDETLTYEVEEILIVGPEDMEPLEPRPGQDLCTLVTCTPYGINSHRLLVRGHRVEDRPEAAGIRILNEGRLLPPLAVAPLVAAPMLFLLLLFLFLPVGKKRPPKNRRH